MKNHPIRSILIVEDNEGDQLLLTELLKSSSLTIGNIIYAATFKEAVSLINTNLVDIILLDLSLPDAKGIQTFHLLKQFSGQIPIVILSGLTDTNLALEAISAGAQDYLVKDDFDKQLLTKTILYSIERKKNLEALHISNERYKLVTKATNDMVWDWDITTGKIFRNREQFRNAFKFPQDEKITIDFWVSRIHPEDIDKVRAIKEELQSDIKNNNFETEYRFLCGDGNYVYLNERGYVLRDKNDKPIRIIGATRDITEKKKAEAELKRLSIIAQETLSAVIICDTAGNIEWVNEAFTKITEYEMNEVLGRKPGSFLQGDETDKKIIDYMRVSIKDELPFKCEIINYSKSGRKYWIQIEAQPFFDKNNKLTHFFAIETDITERVFAEQALKKSETQYRNLFNTSPVNIFIWHLDDFSIAEVNETALKQYGFTREELIKMTVLDLRPPEDYPSIKAFAQRALMTQAFKDTAVWKHLNKNGEELFLQITAEKINYNGKDAILSISINITERIELEKKLEEEKRRKEREINEAVITAQENERLELGRELHDNVNQILVVSRLYLRLVLSKMKENNTQLQETDKMITMAIDELRKMSHSLLPPSFEEKSLLTAIDNIITMTMMGSSLKIKKYFENFNEAGLSNKMQLIIYRIIQEQLTNILKHAEASDVSIMISDKEGITLSIKDNGKGFDPAIKNAGVGIQNIKTRAALLEGKTTIISTPGKGCELLVKFN